MASEENRDYGAWWKLAAIAACRAELRPGKAGKEHEARNVGGRPKGESPLSFLDFPPEADRFGPGSAGIIMKKVSEKS